MAGKIFGLIILIGLGIACFMLIPEIMITIVILFIVVSLAKPNNYK
jgi:hypothetical protein